MITPVDPEYLFEISDNVEITYDEKSRVVIIDNFLKNYEQILDFCENESVVETYDQFARQKSRNMKDYYDCRRYFINRDPDSDLSMKRMLFFNEMAEKYFDTSIKPSKENNFFSFNYFKHIKKVTEEKMQHYPHIDMTFNILVYIDKHSNGGTAFYNKEPVRNTKEKSLIVDISDCELESYVEAKPNRCVMFLGDRFHGAYIKDNEVYVNDWRITLVNFLFKN